MMPDRTGERLTGPVSLVIPGRDCRRTLGPCLEAVSAVAEEKGSILAEIIFVDDGSTDGSRDVASRFPVTILEGAGRGPGAARNIGWKAAASPLIWFVDSDCVAEEDALDRLVEKIGDDAVAGVGGSYGNMCPDSLLAILVHEEIVERHLKMPPVVTFLATFNVLYRREVLERVGGFDERLQKGQDGELAWRILDEGFELRFEVESRVRHFHPTSWWRYLWTQARQGFWRAWMYAAFPARAAGDSYSGLVDHVQPALAILFVMALPLAVGSVVWVVPAVLGAALVAAQVPMACRLVRRTRRPIFAAFVPLGFVRAFWRGFGAVGGLVNLLWRRLAAGRGGAETDGR